ELPPRGGARVSPASLTSGLRRLGRRRLRGVSVDGTGSPLGQGLVDLVLERMRGAEYEHAPRADRHLLAGLRIAPDALAFLAYGKAAEGRDLDHLAAFERIGDLGDHRFDEFGRFVPRQPDLLINSLAQLSAGYRMAGH